MSCKIDDLTLRDVRELKQMFLSPLDASKHPYIIQQGYLVRTVTFCLLGRLDAVYEQELVFADASWVADTGRFYEFLRDGIGNEQVQIEPFPDGGVIVGRGTVVDAAIWHHALPRKTK